jgi:hypothetical protein
MGDLTAAQKQDIERVRTELGRSELLRERLRVLDEALATQEVADAPEQEPPASGGAQEARPPGQA